MLTGSLSKSILGSLFIHELGEDSLVQIQTHRVVVLDHSTEDTLHVTVGTKRFSNVTRETKLCRELHRLEPSDIFGVVEHFSDRGLLLFTSEWCTSQHDSLEHNPIRIHTVQ